MEKQKTTLFRRIIPGILLGFLVFLGLVLAGDLREMGHLMKVFDWRVYPFALLLTLFNYFLRFIKWHYYLNQIGAREIAWKKSMQLFVGGFPLAVTPGKVGEVLKGVWVNQACGLPVARGISVVVAERISDGLAVLGLSTLGVIAYPQYWPAFLIVLLILIGVVVISQIRPAALWALAVGEKIPVVNRFVHGLREFYEGSFALFRPSSTLFAVGLGTISWLGEGIGFYIILLGLGLPPGKELFAMAVFALSFSTIIGAISALPGGLGAAEVSIAGMLTLLGSIPSAVAAAATLLIRFATLWFGVILGLMVWIKTPWLIGIRGENEPIVES